MIVRIFACLWWLPYLAIRPVMKTGPGKRVKRCHRKATHRWFADKFKDPCEDQS